MEITFLNYWKIIIASAHKKTWDRVGVAGLLLDVLVASIVSLVRNKPRPFWAIGFEEIVTALIVIIGLYLFVVIIFIIREPYIQQKDQAKRLAKWEGEKIIATEIELLEREERSEKSPYAWICVENGEKWDLTDCYATLKKVKILSGDMWIDFEHEIIKNTSKLTWPAFGRSEPKIVRRKPDWARINIAKVQNLRIYFTLEDGDRKPDASIHERIYFEIGVNGKLKGKSIKELDYYGYLRYKMTESGPRFFIEKVLKED
jgi:hypothetical protein